MPENPDDFTLANAFDNIIEVNSGTFTTPVWTKVRFTRNLKYSFPATTKDVTTYDDQGSSNTQKVSAGATASFDIQLYRQSLAVPGYLAEVEIIRKAGDPDHLGTAAIREFRIYDRLGADKAYQFKATIAWDQANAGAQDDDVASVTLTGVGKPLVIVNPSSAQALPIITSVTPTTGPAGTAITITGSNLRGVTLVKFGTSNAIADYGSSDTTLVAAVPASGAAGPQNITAVNPAGTSTPATTFTKS